MVVAKIRGRSSIGQCVQTLSTKPAVVATCEELIKAKDRLFIMTRSSGSEADTYLELVSGRRGAGLTAPTPSIAK